MEHHTTLKRSKELMSETNIEESVCCELAFLLGASGQRANREKRGGRDCQQPGWHLPQGVAVYGRRLFLTWGKLRWGSHRSRKYSKTVDPSPPYRKPMILQWVVFHATHSSSITPPQRIMPSYCVSFTALRSTKVEKKNLSISEVNVFSRVPKWTLLKWA